MAISKYQNFDTETISRSQRLYDRGDSPKEIVRRLNADASDFKGMLDSADKTILCSKMKPEDIASVIISYIRG